jgi:hypothetical protein
VTVKMRKGIDDEHLTYLDAGLIAERAGVAAVALHGRTASQAYSGEADWTAIARLKETVRSVPVLGNGDIWSAEDAVRMVEETGCDGVVVGRGCLGRPWLFTDLAAAFAGTPARVEPTLGEVTATMRRHTEYLVDFYGDEFKACRDIRKHIAWYLKGFPAGSTVRHQLALVDSLEALDALIATTDPDAPWPGDAAEGQRGRAGSPRQVALPEGWLDSQELARPRGAPSPRRSCRSPAARTGPTQRCCPATGGMAEQQLFRRTSPGVVPTSRRCRARRRRAAGR